MARSRPRMMERANNILRFSLSGLLGLSIFAATAGGTKLWSSSGPSLWPSSSVALAVLIAAMAMVTLLLRLRRVPIRLDPFGLLAPLPLLFVSDWLTRQYSFLPGAAIRGEILLGLLLSALILFTRRISLILASGAFLAVVLLFGSFVDAAQGRLLFSDDHSVVLFRLSLLREEFPWIPFYYPQWNAGLDARDFFATGALNIFALSSPLVYFSNIVETYNYIVAGIVFVLVPLSAWGGATLLRLPKYTAEISAVLALTSGLMWYRWCLKYGSMGFVTSAALVPLVIGVLYRLFERDEPISLRFATFAVTAITLMLFWSPTGLICLPLGVIALARIRGLITKPRFLGTSAAVLLINIPWILVFLSVSNVDRFVSLKPKTEISQSVLSGRDAPANPEFTQQVVKGTKKKVTPQLLLRKIRDWALTTNPLLLLLGIPGLFLLPHRGSKVFIFVSAVWLFVLGGVIAPLRPQLEFDRMLIIANLVLSLSAGCAMARILSSLAQVPVVLRVWGLIPFGFLCAGVGAVGGIVYNRSPEIYHFSDGTPEQLGRAIQQHGGEGRTVFAGFVLHELSQGHLAPLAVMTDKPLVASSPFHNVWWYTELVPADFGRRKEEGIEEYFDLQNATLVVAHEKRWRDYFLDRPDRYRFVGRHGVFNLFQRLQASNTWFLEGTGSLEEVATSYIRLTTNTSSVVLKFRYFPFLKSNACSLSAEELPGSLQLIRLSNCPIGTPITIEARTGLHRLRY